MRGPAFKSLILAGCVVLALPPGWCRFVYFPVVRGRDKAPAVARGKDEARKEGPRGCCNLGRCEQPDEPAPGSPKPDAPKPAPPSRCCYELDWLKPNPPAKPVVDLSLMAFVTPEDSASTCAVWRHDPGLSFPGPSPPPHLLKCVWLC